MNKTTYKQAYRFARLLNNAKDQNGGNRQQRKEIRQKMKTNAISFIDYKWAETNFYSGLFDQFTTAYSEPIYSFNPEYTRKSHKIITERQFKRRLQEIYGI